MSLFLLFAAAVDVVVVVGVVLTQRSHHRALINIGRDHDLSIERPGIADDVCIVRKASKCAAIRSQCSALMGEIEKFALKRQPLSKKLL